MKVEDAIYRVFSRQRGGERFCGTAFAITPEWFVTCAHVLDQGGDNDHIYLRGPGKHGDIGRLSWIRHPELDLASARLARGLGGVDAFIRLRLIDVTSDLGELRCLGYIDAQSGVQQWIDIVSGSSFADGWIALANTAADGVSGGPVLSGEQVVAIVRADNARKTQKYVLPLISAYSWLESQGFRGTSVAAGPTALCQVPIRPPIRPAEIADAIIRAFALHLPEQSRAIAFIERAMDARRAANPEGFTDDQIVLHRSEITFTGAVVGADLWARVLFAAASKSRRTLAALFLADGAPDSRLMSAPEEVEFNKFVSRLIHPATA